MLERVEQRIFYCLILAKNICLLSVQFSRLKLCEASLIFQLIFCNMMSLNIYLHSLLTCVVLQIGDRDIKIIRMAFGERSTATMVEAVTILGPSLLKHLLPQTHDIITVSDPTGRHLRATWSAVTPLWGHCVGKHIFFRSITSVTLILTL